MSESANVSEILSETVLDIEAIVNEVRFAILLNYKPLLFSYFLFLLIQNGESLNMKQYPLY